MDGKLPFDEAKVRCAVASVVYVFSLSCNQERRNKMKHTRKLVYMAMFIALEIVLTRLVSLMPSNTTRISLSFVVYAFAGNMFGPVFGLISAAIGDLVGAILFPPIGGFFPGFTLSAAVSGFIFGYVILGKKQYLRGTIILLVNTLLVDVLMNTLWLSIITKTPFILRLQLRLPGILVNNVLRFVILFILIQKDIQGVLHEKGYSNRSKRKIGEDH